MTLIDLDSKDVQNYTNKDGLIAISDLRILALTDDYVKVDEVLKIIDKEHADQQLKCGNLVQLIAAHNALKNLADLVKELRGEEE